METLTLVIWGPGNVYMCLCMTNASFGHCLQVPAADGEGFGRREPHAEAPVGLFEVGRHGCEAVCRRRHHTYR